MSISITNFNIVVLIATIGRSEYLKNTLLSLDECSKPDNFTQIFIVENGGRDNAQLVVDQFDSGYFQYIYFNGRGKSAALNYVIRNYITNDDLLLFTDDDILVNKYWVEKYNYYAARYGRRFYYGGSFDVLYENEVDSYIKHLLPLSARGITDDEHRERNIFLGFNWASFRSDIVQAGLFDETIGPGSKSGSTGQETNMQQRLLSAGCRPIFIENNMVSHVIPESRATIQWISQRAVSEGIENSYKQNGHIHSEIYRIFKLMLRIIINFLRGNKFNINRNLYSLIKLSVALLIKTNQGNNNRAN